MKRLLSAVVVLIFWSLLMYSFGLGIGLNDKQKEINVLKEKHLAEIRRVSEASSYFGQALAYEDIFARECIEWRKKDE